MNTIHIAQGPGAESTTVPQLFAGDTPAVVTRDVPFLTAQGAIPQYTPLTFDAATGTYIAWTAAAVAADALPISAVTAYAIPDLTVDQRAAVYIGGCFNVDAIAWPESTTEAHVEAAVNSSAHNSLLQFRKLLYSDKRVDATDLDVGPGNQPPPE
jgi:hypothetical protein